MAGYRMGFEISPDAGGSLVRASIDYDLPGSFGGRLLGHLLAKPFADWCLKGTLGAAGRSAKSKRAADGRSEGVLDGRQTPRHREDDTPGE
jgi:hypothetical protein